MFPSGSPINNHHHRRDSLTQCHLLKRWAGLALGAEAKNGHMGVSLENVGGRRIKGAMYPWYLETIFFHLSKSQVFIYKIKDKVASKYMHWEAVWHHVKSIDMGAWKIWVCTCLIAMLLWENSLSYADFSVHVFETESLIFTSFWGLEDGHDVSGIQ